MNGLIQVATVLKAGFSACLPGLGSGRGFVLLILLLGPLGGSLRAHDVGLSVARLELRADSAELSVSFAPADAALMLPFSAQSADPWGRGFAAVRPALAELAPLLVELRVGETALVPRDLDVQYTPDDHIVFKYLYARPPAGPVEFRALNLGVLPRAHRQDFTALDREVPVVSKVLSTKDAAAPFVVPGAGAAPPAPAARTSAVEFLKLGIEHIWTGYDHLLFLFGLLVVCRTFKSIVTIITCFTLAHSLTLALATLDVVNLPARFVEPAIAASIVFVGLENLSRGGDEPRGRWALTFLFGLVHGFGFASVLRDLGIGAGGQGLALPLLLFNLGVEIGQVAVAALVLPLVWQLRKKPAFVRGVPVASALVAAAGLYWLVERTLLA